MSSTGLVGGVACQVLHWMPCSSYMATVPVYPGDRGQDGPTWANIYEENGKYFSGWWFGCHQFHFPINIGNLIIPLDSYFSEGWPWPTNQLFSWHSMTETSDFTRKGRDDSVVTWACALQNSSWLTRSCCESMRELEIIRSLFGNETRQWTMPFSWVFHFNAKSVLCSLVLWNINFVFPYHPMWLTHIFSEGLKSTTNQFVFYQRQVFWDSKPFHVVNHPHESIKVIGCSLWKWTHRTGAWSKIFCPDCEEGTCSDSFDGFQDMWLATGEIRHFLWYF